MKPHKHHGYVRDVLSTLASMGEKRSAIGIGGSHIGWNGLDEQLRLRISRTAVIRGIHFMDTRTMGFNKRRLAMKILSFFGAEER